MPERIANLQALRGIAILLVVLLHVAAIEERYATGATLLAKRFGVGAAGVDLFFVISGLVMVTVTRGKFQRLSDILDFLYHRLTRIYPLYWLYTALTLAIYLLLPNLVSQPDRLANHQVMASFLLLPQRDLPLVIVGWTLIHELYFYAVFALLLAAPEKQLGKGLLIWGFGVCLGHWSIGQGLFSEPTPATDLLFHPHTLEFIAGGLIARLIYRGHSARGLCILLIGSGLLAAQIGLYRVSAVTDVPHGGWRILVFGIPCALIVYGAVAAEIQHRIMLPGWLRRIGDASYSIYLSHVLVVAALGKLWSMSVLARPELASSLLAILLMLAAVLAVGFGNYRLVEKPLLAFSRRAKSASLSFKEKLS